MKRSAAPETNQANKKQKTVHNAQNGLQKILSPEEQNFQPILRKNFRYLVDHVKIGKRPGHIQGIVKMIYNPAEKDRFILELTESAVQDGRKESPLLEVVLSKLHLQTLDPLVIKDTVNISLKGARLEMSGAKKHTLPVRLYFTEGYHLRFGHRDSVVDINTFNAPPKRKSVEQMVQRPVSIPPGVAQNRRLELSKKERRRSKELKRSGEGVSQSVKTEQPSLALPGLAPVQFKPPTEQPIAGPSNVNAQEQAEPSLPTKPTHQVDPAALRPPPLYKPLKDLKPPKANCSIIAVVLYSEAPTKPRNDWMKKLRVVDSSDYDVTRRKNGTSCILFAETVDDLPQLEDGDIIVLKSVQLNDWCGNPQIAGIRGRYGWAAFSKRTGQIYWNDSGQKDGPPRSEVLNSRRPFYVPEGDEVRYCKQLSEWWQKREEKQKEEDEKNCVVPSTYRKGTRRHRLVEELQIPDSNTPLSDEYFNCTVEIWGHFANDNGVHSLFVTDYTKNDRCFIPEGHEWPPGLAPFIFRIECWDGAAEQAKVLEEKVYCRFNNTRIRMNSAGFLEGKQSEAKIEVLPEDTEEADFKAFIQRKQAFEKEMGALEVKYEDASFEDAKLDAFFHCTVEVLQTDYSESKGTGTVFCTDYSVRNDTGGVPKDALWARKLDRNRIVKLVLADSQASVAKCLKVGDICRFRKMRLRQDKLNKYTIGYLGGKQDLMEKLRPDNKENEPLQALIRRKVGFGISKLSKTLKSILDSDRFPSQHRLVGRIISQDPKNLDAAVVMYCKSCDRELTSLEKMCRECESEEDLEPRSNLFLNIEDTNLNRAFIHIPEKSRIFEGVDLLRFLDDSSVRDSVKKRLEAISSARRQEDAKSPLLLLDVRAYKDKQNDVALFLMAATECPPL